MYKNTYLGNKMRILVIGNAKSSEILVNFLSSDKKLLVFATKENTKGNPTNINPDNIEELKEFALANEINLTIVADPAFFHLDYLSVFNENNLAILIPDIETLKITTSKCFGKKFMYRNKILTPKFSFFERPNLAVDYVKNVQFPIVIKPDSHCATESAYIAETFGSARRQIEKLFQTDNKKVLIEDYIYGKEITFYILTDGFNAILLDFIKTYENKLAVKGFYDKTLEAKIYQEIIQPTISNLAEAGNEYIGILGFDIIITPENKAYLIEYNSFFKDLDTELMLRGTDENWAEIFMDAIVGTLQDKFVSPFEIKKNDYHGSFISPEPSKEYGCEEIITESARTYGNLKTKLLEEGLNPSDLKDAEDLWKL